ncbi:Gfo/Idh/MocA family oxidoreductase [Candidatus Bathyarchaeota archaeon]|nr:Gfo/Idh/MocA family oxidoreductase [Candidatus Bathyarchaeota archaeon]
MADFAKLGYHILCEKPMATNIADCVKMIRDVNGSPVPAVFGMGHGMNSAEAPRTIIMAS